MNDEITVTVSKQALSKVWEEALYRQRQAMDAHFHESARVIEEATEAVYRAMQKAQQGQGVA